MKCETCGVSYSSGTMHSCKPVVDEYCPHGNIDGECLRCDSYGYFTEEEREDYRNTVEKLIQPTEDIIGMWRKTAESYHEQWQSILNDNHELEEQLKKVEQDFSDALEILRAFRRRALDAEERIKELEEVINHQSRKILRYQRGV